MSAITNEIAEIESQVNDWFSADLPIDSKKIKRLAELRVERLKELVTTHEQRSFIMKQKTHAMTAKISTLNLDAKPDVKEKLIEEQEKYDKAVVHWVNSESCLWEKSEAFSIAAGILILANS